MSGTRRLVILRHAKSAWPEGVPDHDRPLNARGLRDAPAAGRGLAAAGVLPDLVLCSTARRTRQTWGLASAELATAPPVRHDPRLYGAHEDDLLAFVREAPPAVRTLLLVGHNPGLQELTLRLTGEADGDHLDRARTKFPTSGTAVLTWSGPWSALLPGSALLTDFAVPRGRREGRH
ncbi:SixA phosphatase family protein [Streptomyces sp. H39-S7]|uniref:SixA phosphatase family protein n=1 Tax=Streptomyces sp. H39-S7 TaxID=3004357 RepID=UPI0022AF2AFA|nr:histidine phosphatase family protein [Streptomyces sp. H39-S7]MCZ4123293.1 histidine phosphatase family protein [Streptomyces sp. H39-S7]